MVNLKHESRKNSQRMALLEGAALGMIAFLPGMEDKIPPEVFMYLYGASVIIKFMFVAHKQNLSNDQ